MFVRGETYKSSANVSSTIRPNIPKFLFKVKKGDQVQYNPPLRTIDLSKAQALPHFPKPARRKDSAHGIIKRWSLRRSLKRKKSSASNSSRSPPSKAVSRSNSGVSQSHNFVKRWSLKRRPNNPQPGISTISSDWSAMDEPDEGGSCEEESFPVQCRIRRWSVATRQKSQPNSLSTRNKMEPDTVIEENSVIKIKQSSSLRQKPAVKDKRASWRLSLQDAIIGANKAAVYLQDTGAVSPSEELRALKRTLSGAQFYKENSALMFLFPETDPTPTSRLGSLIRRTSSRKSQLERKEEKSLKKWRKRFMGVNKKFVLKHLVSQ